MTQHNDRCLACGQDENVTPLISLRYRGTDYRICPQHLPVLIHRPHELLGKLPGAETLKPADVHD